jgi:hypothetical protein
VFQGEYFAIMRRTLLLLVALSIPVLGAGSEREVNDLKRSIDTHRGTVSDLERQDAQRTVSDQLTLLRTWVDESANLLGQKKLDRVREVLDRLNAQEELIRQRMAAAAATAAAREREEALRALQDKIEQTKTAIEQATVTKKALEMNAK